ncbi:GNAT family N-acetyltransferase [Xylanimonas sp. McL0601]|uniref:GNAT family N-acetyltransferase n=1 Tax=Xylanimonas sp. McL0601 TaxID=3414739 RepID=UPI003CEC2BA9
MTHGDVEYEFSPDPRRIDAAWVHAMLTEHASWAAGRPREVHEAAMAGSRNYGVFLLAGGGQVAYARLVTDGATFGWLADVIVDPEHQGRGVGRALVAGILADLEPLGLRRILLKATDEGRGLYAQHGWASVEQPDAWMVRHA